MPQQEGLSPHPSDSRMQGGHPCPTIQSDTSSTFVKPLFDGASQSFSPYPYSAGTAIPPPPPYLYPPLPSQPKRNRVHVITITILAVLVVLLGSLEVVQLAVPTLLTTYPSGSTGSNHAGINPAQNTTSPFKTTPVRILTPGTIKENMMLTCGVCNDP